MNRTDFGVWTGHVPLFDTYENWRDYRLQCVEAGVNPRTGQPFEGQLLEAFASGNRAILEASPDTKADFATFLWEPVVANHEKGFDTVAPIWDRYVGIRSVSTFDPVRTKRTNGLTGIGYVGELGEFPGLRRTFGPDSSIVVDTYGGEYAMTRKLLRSQGVQELVARNPADLGTAAGNFVTRMIIAFIVANPNASDGLPLFSSTRGNLVTTPIGIDALVDAATWLGSRRNADNEPIDVQLRSAVTQNQRSALLLRQAVKSQQVMLQNGGTPEAANRFGRGTDNPIPDSGILPADGIVIDRWLPDAQDIYYFGDPANNPAVVAAFLDGQRKPMIGMTDATIMHLANSAGSGMDPYTMPGQSLEWWTRLDVGVATYEPLGGYKQSPA